MEKDSTGGKIGGGRARQKHHREERGRKEITRLHSQGNVKLCKCRNSEKPISNIPGRGNL